MYFTATKRVFSSFEITLHYFKKTLEKNDITLYNCYVGCGTYLGIAQSMKHKFVSIAANTWKNHMFNTDFLSCLFFRIFWPGPILLSLQRQQTFPKIRL